MTIFYTSDTHFMHRNITYYDRLNWDFKSNGEYPFNDYQERDAAIIERWNSVVSGNDTVYILGDFCYAKRDAAAELLSKLHGRKHIIKGNHDNAWLGSLVGDPGLNLKSFQDYLVVSDQCQKIVLSHYPIFAWDDQHKGAYHIYGHVHSSKEERLFQQAGRMLLENDLEEFRAMNAGIMLYDYHPVTFNELVARYGLSLGRFV